MNKPAVISARVDSDLLVELDRIALAHRRSRAWLVGEAVRRYTAQEAELLAMIEAGEQSLRDAPTESPQDRAAWMAAKRTEVAVKRQFCPK